MTNTNDNPKTLLEAVTFFADFEHCRTFMVAARWSDGVVRCPRCESDHVTYLEKARVWKCYGRHDRPKFSLKVGTIFEDSSIPLEKWLPVVWLLANCKNGISSYEVAKAIGVTQKSAWFMLHRVRLAMQTGSFMKLKGEVEIDETYIGGKARNMHRDRREKIKGGHHVGKVAVMGLLERHGEVRLHVVPNVRKKKLQKQVLKDVEPESEVFTDALKSYDDLFIKYQHSVIDHAESYAQGKVHTNGLENFWSLLKRAIHGTYISTMPFHLFRYLDEQAFRYNLRKLTDAERFLAVLRQIVGRRLTYDELIGETA